MENDKGLMAWLADVYRAGYESFVHFWWTFYSGVPAAWTVDMAHRAEQEVPENAP